ncbi:MAG: IS4 family transposase [Verrucomicrobiae bacterium]|nr:IS4 family transposase [Verrucomicrobiae bacterium]MCP5522266.1 IS4 family transposase [Verrucomicrobiales bacterium]
MQVDNAAAEDWELLTTFFPAAWRDLARTTGALKGLRQDKGEENYLRVLMLHFGCGLSMRETVARAKQAKLAEISPVALFKRLRKSREWLYQLCCELFAERGVAPTPITGRPLRIIDATIVKEPGPTGTQWRIHYSLCWPTLRCDYFKLSAVEGEGTGESLRQFPIAQGEHLLADRGYCHARGIHYATERKSHITVRLNPDGIALKTLAGDAFPLLKKLKSLQRCGQIATWDAQVPLAERSPVPVRICAIRKSKTAIAMAHKQLRRKASKHGSALQPETLIYAEYVMVLTTFPEKEFPPTLVLEWYRFRWQIELVFKRFKQIARLGHLPKQDEESSKAWLYGKLFVALLTEKVLVEARALSPWGFGLPAQRTAESLA